MGHFVMSDRLSRDTKAMQFQRAIEANLIGESIELGPFDNRNDVLRVLIVDGDRATTNSLSSHVTLWGHDARHAYDGVTGLALAAAFRPDVLLLDMLLPNVSGIEVTMQVRRQDRLKNCFIVAVTRRTDVTHRRRCYDAGVDLVLIKPLVPSDMQTLLLLESQRIRSRRDKNLIQIGKLNGN
jgi:DNA-binding response OmpR family regulator